MAIGAAAGFAGIKLPILEAVIRTSVLVIGGLFIGAVRLTTAWARALVGLFAVFRGHARASEVSENSVGTYILGFLPATTLLGGLGIRLG